MSAQPPQPNLAWQFEGTTTDYVKGLTGTTTGSVTYGPGKYNQGMSVFNVVGTDSASNLVSYSVVLNSTNGFTVSVWTRVDVVKTGSYASMIGLSATTNTGGFFNFFDITENAGGTFAFYGQNQSGSGTVPVPFNTSTTPVLGGWYHVTTVFTNSTISMYVNGIASGSTTYANAFTTNTMYLGRSGQYSGHSYCGSYDDLRLFNTALSAAQVQTIYAAQGMPNQMSLSVVSAGGTNAYMGGNPFFSSAVSATNSVVGYSLRALSGTYVKVVNVRNGTTSATQDFYADIFGNLTITGSGQSLADWLRGATGYAVTWYDQSGAGNNATQVTAANQPIIQKATNGPGYSLLFDGATQYLVGMSYTVLNGKNYSFSVVERRNSAAIMMAISSGDAAKDDGFHFGYYTGGTIVRFGQYSDDIDINPYPAYAGASEPVHYWVGTESSTSGRFLYENGTVSTSDATLKTLLSSVSGNFQVGTRLFGSTYYYSGEIYEVLVWTSRSLTSSDVSKAYSDQSGYITGSKITSITLQ